MLTQEISEGRKAFGPFEFVTEYAVDHKVDTAVQRYLGVIVSNETKNLSFYQKIVGLCQPRDIDAPKMLKSNFSSSYISSART